jgi:hypothetical protein
MENGGTQECVCPNGQTQIRYVLPVVGRAVLTILVYAAAFFLLADHLKDAVSVLSNQLDDVQLAIAVARVYEGDDGPVLHEFLVEKILPQATVDGNRWMATWALWMLKKRDRAVRALIVSYI